MRPIYLIIIGLVNILLGTWLVYKAIGWSGIVLKNGNIIHW